MSRPHAASSLRYLLGWHAVVVQDEFRFCWLPRVRRLSEEVPVSHCPNLELAQAIGAWMVQTPRMTQVVSERWPQLWVPVRQLSKQHYAQSYSSLTSESHKIDLKGNQRQFLRECNAPSVVIEREMEVLYGRWIPPDVRPCFHIEISTIPK